MNKAVVAQKGPVLDKAVRPSPRPILGRRGTGAGRPLLPTLLGAYGAGGWRRTFEEVTGMDHDDAAQRQMAALAAQQMMIGMSDNPRQFHEDLASRLFRQAWDARYGHRDGMKYSTVLF